MFPKIRIFKYLRHPWVGRRENAKYISNFPQNYPTRTMLNQDREAPICPCEVSRHCFRWRLFADAVPSHCLNQCWLIANRTFGNKFKWILVNYTDVHTRCEMWKFHPQNGGYFISPSMCWYRNGSLFLRIPLHSIRMASDLLSNWINLLNLIWLRIMAPWRHQCELWPLEQNKGSAAVYAEAFYSTELRSSHGI